MQTDQSARFNSQVLNSFLKQAPGETQLRNENTLRHNTDDTTGMSSSTCDKNEGTEKKLKLVWSRALELAKHCCWQSIPRQNAYNRFRFDSCSTTLPILSELIGKEDTKAKQQYAIPDNANNDDVLRDQTSIKL